MTTHFDAVAEAFSRKSEVYDAFGVDHPNLTRMREKVYARIAATVPPDSHLLELNAGTGLDASTLAQRGYRVHATDLAPGMVLQIEDKIKRYNLQGRLTTEQISFTLLDQLTNKGPFDAVYSNFGGLNCIDDLTQVTRHLPHILKPNGVAIWVIMPPICLWELARIPQDFRMATRRLSGQDRRSSVEGIEFVTTYFTPRQVRRSFGADFRFVSLEGLSILTPPADNKSFSVRFPRLYSALATLDDLASHLPLLNQCGDFFILTMRYDPR
jgi:ubiquinone/menaquinone biosynthesis C-methylase UbiE